MKFKIEQQFLKEKMTLQEEKRQLLQRQKQLEEALAQEKEKADKTR